MDGDPSQEDRIRLIGRLFFIFIVREVNSRLLCQKMFVQVAAKPVADLDVFVGKSWANMGSFMGRFELQTTSQS
jgi:hypothetical protein